MSAIENKTLSVAIMSGKGGVGKSNIAINLAYALAQNDLSTILMDCDLGLANLDVLLGIAPDNNLSDVLAGNIPVESVVLPLNEENTFALLPSASGMQELADMQQDERIKLLENITPAFKNYSMLLLDLGAGIDENIQYFASISAVRVVILTPEPTSLTDAYALIKILKNQQNVSEFLIVVNQAQTTKEAKAVFEALATQCKSFLKVSPVFLGVVHTDSKLVNAVRKQKPLLHIYPDSKAAQDIRNIALRLAKIYPTMLPRIAAHSPLHEKNII